MELRSGLTPMSNLGWAEAVGGGFRRSFAVDESIIPLRFEGPRVLAMREGAWTGVEEVSILSKREVQSHVGDSHGPAQSMTSRWYR